MISKETIDKIFETARIEEVVGEFVVLKKAGSNYKGLSPFVNEKTPSFMVSPAKQIFKDFSSGKGGSVVTFLMEHEQLSYPEALRWLAAKYNIEIEEDQVPENFQEQQTLRESLFVVNSFAQKYFSDQLLQSDKGKSVGLSYFKERGFRQDIIEKFHLGYCPEEWDLFTQHALQNAFKKEFLITTGLTKQTEGGKLYDFYRGRVIFPIHNITGRIAGFGGRVLRGEKETAKYINSPESEIYNKSKILYGMYFAKKAIVSKDICYLVEGYTDVVSMHQAGIENVVASSGTALTEDQIRLIRRYTPNLTIIYDGDSAGIKAATRGLDMALKEGLNIRAVLLPEGEDPDSFSKKVSATELENFITSNSKDFIRFKTELMLTEVSSDPIKKSQLIREIVESIALIPDAISRSIYIRDCTTLFDIPEQALINELNKRLRNKIRKDAPGYEEVIISENPLVHKKKAELAEDVLHHQEVDILHKLLNYGTQSISISIIDDEGKEIGVDMPVAQFIINELVVDEIKLTNPVYQKIVDEYQRAIEGGIVPTVQHFIQTEDTEISNCAVDLTSSPYLLSHNWQNKHKIYPETEEMKLKRAVEEAVFTYKLKVVNQMKEQLQEELKTISEEDLVDNLEKQKYLQEVIKLICQKLNIVITK
ncbi:MAG: DNA primase [Flavobacteriales bacterium]